MAVFAPLHTGQFVVKPRVRARRRMTMSLIALLMLLLPYATFETGRALAGYSVTNSVRVQWLQSQRIAALEAEMAQLHRQLNTRSIGQTIDQHSAASLQQTVDELQRQMQQQRSELAFYQSIVSPAAGAPSEPSVQRIEIEPSAEPRHFVLRLVLIQPMQAAGQAYGTAQVEINGTRDGQALTVPLRELTGAEQLNAFKFAYRYFQVIEQPIELAAGFTPSEVSIELHGSQRAPRRQTFSWQLQPAGGSTHVQTS